MSFVKFKGGIHTYEGKDLSKDKPVKTLLPPQELVYPMKQHIGESAIPLVKKGDEVLVGQKIGEAAKGISACIISSVSGKVKIVEPRLTASGEKILSVVVENDETYTTVEGFGEKRDYTTLSKEEIRSLIKEAGIVGMGGAGFPTHIKLTPGNDEKIEYVIVNGAECEPYLTSDYRMMIEETKALVGGLKVILSLFEKAKGVIAIEDNKPEAIQKIKEATKEFSNIEVHVLNSKYPQGAERVLIDQVTGRRMHARMLPKEIGCIVNNVDTVIAIYNAVCESTPLIRRILTVSGDAILNPQNYNVRIGTSYAKLLEASGGLKNEVEKMISGGPMMGAALYSLEVPITKVSSALTCFTKDEVAKDEASSCIRCARCIQVCPAKVLPQKMMEAAKNFDEEAFEKLNGIECCECGCCTYVCPSKIKLTQLFKQTKGSIVKKCRAGRDKK